MDCEACVDALSGCLRLTMRSLIIRNFQVRNDRFVVLNWPRDVLVYANSVDSGRCYSYFGGLLSFDARSLVHEACDLLRLIYC